MKKNMLYFLAVVAVVALGWFVFQNQGKGICETKESASETKHFKVILIRLAKKWKAVGNVLFTIRQTKSIIPQNY